MANPKERLDVLVHERGLAPSREMARRYILAGEVKVNGMVQTKAGTKIPLSAEIEVISAAKYVSRGGYKLETALNAFRLTIAGQVCADLSVLTSARVPAALPTVSCKMARQKFMPLMWAMDSWRSNSVMIPA
jgi:23S rRNA (cytidine1920-2'-O)/16S rRNA (cytidine1409-2'-O)-methyltransferase